MGISYRLYLDERTPKADHKYPLKLRVTLDRKHKYIPLGILLESKDWDKKAQKVKSSHPNSKLITLKINQTINEIQQKALHLDTTEQVYDISNIVGTSNKVYTTFKAFADEQIKQMHKAGKIGNAITYQTATNKLIEFAKRTVYALNK